MSNIDKQRITAVRTLVDMGYVFWDEWITPAGLAMQATAEADAMRCKSKLSLDRCSHGWR